MGYVFRTRRRVRYFAGNVGSFNHTRPAEQLNPIPAFPCEGKGKMIAAGFDDENIVILGDLDATTKTAIKKQKRLAAYALGEIDRLIEAFG